VRIAVTGCGGRLGRALLAALVEAPFAGPSGTLGWDLPEHDLDTRGTDARLIERDRPDVVIHTAAWTDVDGCARDPDLAVRRNGTAVGELAGACLAAGVDLVLVSTNEVFDGRRTDGRGYRPSDLPRPINAYGASKLAGEIAARTAFVRGGGVVEADRGEPPPARPRLAIVRTAWLYGPPGNDFPAKILAAADRARAAGESLRVVGDEVGSPTYTVDLARAVARLVGAGSFAGVHHVVNGGTASRAAWAREVLRLVGNDVAVEEVPSATWRRASSPPLWAVLEPTLLPSGRPLRPWPEALAEYVPALLGQRAEPTR